jgi:hypothetical protein
VKIDEDDNHKKYGFYSDISGSGSGSKLGVYAVIDPNANGNHYAIYGRATRNAANTYAGYFYGDAKVTGKLKSEDSGDADMKAYAYGLISAGAIKITSGSSDGFTVSQPTSGYYDITFDNYLGSGSNYIVLVTLEDLGRIWVTNKSANGFQVRIKNVTGGFSNKQFQFVVYKK